MFVGSCSIVISGLLLLSGTKNRPFDCRIGSISIKKIPPSTDCFKLGFQQKNLLFSRYFNEFLMAHHRQVAREIRDEYIDTMSKIYFSYFKTYISKLLKLQVSVLRPNSDFTLDTQTPIWASFFGLTQSVERLPVEREVAGSISPDRINTQGLPLSSKSDQIQFSPYKIKT